MAGRADRVEVLLADLDRQVGPPFALVKPSQRRCRVCSEPLEARARRDAVYCGGACRMAALRARAA